MGNSRQSRERWLDTAVGGIRFKPDRKAVRAELRAHLEDKAEDLRRIFPDLTPEEAEARAVKEMGDAAEIGREMARLHRPWLGYLWRASQAALALLLLVMMIVGANMATGSSGLGDWYQRGDNWRADEYGAVELAPAAEEVRVEGCTIAMSRAARWSDGEEAILEVLLRVEDLRFWRKGGEQLNLVSARDDRGGYYSSWYEWHEFGRWFEQGYISVTRDSWGPSIRPICCRYAALTRRPDGLS